MTPAQIKALEAIRDATEPPGLHSTAGMWQQLYDANEMVRELLFDARKLTGDRT